MVSVFLLFRALEVWGSQEALARERDQRKEVEREYQESMKFHPHLLHYLFILQSSFRPNK